MMADQTDLLVNCLRDYYHIDATVINLLSVGADINATVYKVQASDKRAYFVKCIRGHSHDISLEVIELLQKTGMQQLISPIKTVDGKSVHQVGDLMIIVYPFIQGVDGFSRPLTEEQWVVLGKALKQVHEVDLPAPLQDKLRRETFLSKWRDAVQSVYDQEVPDGDEVALNLWEFLQKNRAIIQRLVDRSEKLSHEVRHRPLQFVLCHSDIHGGNVLIDDHRAIYIVDWDAPILAPKERDLMFIGGGVGNVWNQPQEETFFYQGYGQTTIDRQLLSYYRHERIVEDIGEYCQELLLQSAGGSKNRMEMYQQFLDMFASNGVVEIAFATDRQAI
jgi:spectinomycin phosphotransferase